MANRIVDIPEANSLVAADIRNRFVLYVIDPLGTPTKADLKTTVEQLRAYLAASSDPGAVRAIEANDDGTFKYTKGDGSEVTVGLFPLNPTDGQVISWDMTSSSLVWKDIESLEFSIPDGSITAEKLADGVIPTGGGSGAEHSGAYIAGKLGGLSGDNKLSLAALKFSDIEESESTSSDSNVLIIPDALIEAAPAEVASRFAPAVTSAGRSRRGYISAEFRSNFSDSYMVTPGDNPFKYIIAIDEDDIDDVGGQGFVDMEIFLRSSTPILSRLIVTDESDNSEIINTELLQELNTDVGAAPYVQVREGYKRINVDNTRVDVSRLDGYALSLDGRFYSVQLLDADGNNIESVGDSLPSLKVTPISDIVSGPSVVKKLEALENDGRLAASALKFNTIDDSSIVDASSKLLTISRVNTDGLEPSFVPITLRTAPTYLGYMSADGLLSVAFVMTPGENPLKNFGYIITQGLVQFSVLDSVPLVDRIIITDNSDGSEFDQAAVYNSSARSPISNNVYKTYLVSTSPTNSGFNFNPDGRSYSVQLIDADGDRIEGSGAYSVSGDDILALNLTPISDIIESIAVTTDKIEDDAVTTSKIKDGAITAAKLAAGVITSGGGSDTGLQEHIAEAQQEFDTLQLSLQDLTVTIQSESQQRVQVDQTLRSSIEDLEADGSVTSTRIDTHAVTTDKIEGGAVTAEKIGNHAVTTDKIEPGAVTATKIEDGAVTAAKIAAGVLTESASAAVAIHRVEVQGEIQQLVSQIESESGVRSASDVTLTTADATLQSSITDLEADGSVTNSRIKDGAITADKLAEGVGEHSGAYIVGKLDALAGDSRLEISAVKVSGIEKSAAIFDDSRLLTLKGIPTIPQRSFIPTVRHYTNATFRGYVSPDGGTALYATLGVVGITPAVSPNLITSDTEVFNHVIYMDISAAGLTMYVRSSSPRFSRIKIIDNSDSTEFFNRTAVPDETAVKTSAGISYREYKYLDFTNNFNFDGRSYSVVLVAEDGSTLELPDPDFESNLKNLQITPLSDFAKRIVADGSITAAKLAPDSVTGDKILDKAITADKLADGVIPSGAGSSAEVVRTHVRIKGLRAPLAPGDISLSNPLPSGYNTCIIWNDNLPLDFGNSENIMANIVTNDDVTNTFTLPEGVWFISVDGHIRNNSGPFSSNNSRMDGNIQISNSSYTVKGDSVYFRASNAGNFYNKTATRIKDGVTETIACQSFAVRNVNGNLGASGIFASDGVTPFYIYARLIAQSTSGTVRFDDFNFDFRRMY